MNIMKYPLLLAIHTVLLTIIIFYDAIEISLGKVFKSLSLRALSTNSMFRDKKKQKNSWSYDWCRLIKLYFRSISNFAFAFLFICLLTTTQFGTGKIKLD